MKRSCMFLSLFAVALGVFFTVDGSALNLNTRSQEECDKWVQEKQCLENPRFMWSNCLTSCLVSAKDDDERCKRWAEEGECLANPNYVSHHCPKACGGALGWNPYLRHAQGIPEVPKNEKIENESCGVPVDLLSAADVMVARLEKLFAGAHNSVIGLTHTAPTEYLGMFGIAEAIMYTFRLHEAIFNKVKNYDLEHHSHDGISYAMNVIKSGYSPDTLMRNMPFMLDYLSRSTNAAHIHYNIPFWNFDATKGCRHLSVGPKFTDLIAYVSGGVETVDTTKRNYNTAAAADAVEAMTTLSNGVKMPVVGLGTWQLTGADCKETVEHAIEIGYRAFDTAQAYGNEVEIGKAISEAIRGKKVKRADLFIATKISDEKDGGKENTKKLVDKQLKDLQVQYIDLYMLHSPMPEPLQKETWEALEALYDKKVIHALGVSNFNEKDLKNLMSYAKHKPTVVQNKVDPYHIGKQLDPQGDHIMTYCKNNNIKMMAYSPFSAYPFAMLPTEDPIIRHIAAEKEVPQVLKSQGISEFTPAQIILRWMLQKGMVAIPRASKNAHLRDNLVAMSVPALTDYEMKLMDTLQFLVSSPMSKAVHF